MAEFRGRGGCPCADEETFSGLDFRARAFLKTLHSMKSILNEAECRSVGARYFWDDELAVILATKSPDVVQETLGMLEEYKGQWRYHHPAKGIQMLSELFQEKLVTEDDVERMKGEEGYLFYRVVHVQCTKPPEVVARTADVLDKCGYIASARKLRAMNELFTRHLLTTEEYSEVARKRWWEDHLAQALSTKPVEVWQEAIEVLEKHGCCVKKLKTLNELFARHLLTAEECSEMASKTEWWEGHLVQFLSTKPAEVVQEACQVLEKHGCPVEMLKKLHKDLPDKPVTVDAGLLDMEEEESRQLRALNDLFNRGLLTAEQCNEEARKGWLKWEDRLTLVLLTEFAVQEACHVLERHGYSVKELKMLSELYQERLVTEDEVERIKGDGGDLPKRLVTVQCTKPPEVVTRTAGVLDKFGHTEEARQLRESSMSWMKLSSEGVEEEATPQGSKVQSQSAGGGSDPPEGPDTAAAAEAALDDHCWIPFGFQLQSVGPEGGKVCLQPSAGAVGGEEEETILLEVPPGAVSPSESVEIHSAVIPDGPFTLLEGYQLGSMVVYVYYDSQCVTQPLKLRLPHWYGGEDHIQDGLSFAMAPHALKEGESVYHFELLEGGRFADQRQCGVLQISGHCTLFAAVFKVKASSHYYASLWTHQVAGNVICGNEMDTKVVITYADQVWIEVLEKYWKDWNRRHTDPPFPFMFSGKKVRGMLSLPCGEGWEASLKGAATVHSSEVAYHGGRYSHRGLKSAVKMHSYPPAIHCVVMYDSPPDCSRGVKMNRLSIEGTNKGRISFPFKVYEVKTPHIPSSLSTSSSSSMGTSSLLSLMNTEEAPPSLVHMVLDKYEEEFIQCVDAKLRLRKLIRKRVITDTIKGAIESANDDDSREILFDHLRRNADVDTLKKYLKVAIAAEGYPNMQALGRKMKEELQ